MLRSVKRFGGKQKLSASHSPRVADKKGKKEAFSEDKLSLGRDVFMKHPRLMNKNVGDNLFLSF